MSIEQERLFWNVLEVLVLLSGAGILPLSLHPSSDLSYLSLTWQIQSPPQHEILPLLRRPGVEVCANPPPARHVAEAASEV